MRVAVLLVLVLAACLGDDDGPACPDDIGPGDHYVLSVAIDPSVERADYVCDGEDPILGDDWPSRYRPCGDPLSTLATGGLDGDALFVLPTPPSFSGWRPQIEADLGEPRTARLCGAETTPAARARFRTTTAPSAGPSPSTANLNPAPLSSSTWTSSSPTVPASRAVSW